MAFSSALLILSLFAFAPTTISLPPTESPGAPTIAPASDSSGYLSSPPAPSAPDSAPALATSPRAPMGPSTSPSPSPSQGPTIALASGPSSSLSFPPAPSMPESTPAVRATPSKPVSGAFVVQGSSTAALLALLGGIALLV